MRVLYPEIAPSKTYNLQIDGHTIYYEECGKQDGIPILFLHGGPGSGADEDHRRYYDPKQYRIIIFDQRGCSRSAPFGELKDNDTHKLINDMEAIRLALNIDRWIVVGGSWGATLALLYTQLYPTQVLGLILRGSFLARQQDLDWFASDHGVSRILPDYWAEFTSHFKHQDRFLELYEQVFSDDSEQAFNYAQAWALWSGRVVTHNITANYQLKEEYNDKLVTVVRIEMHYAKHRYFIAENQVLDQLDKLPKNIPIWIIHGRHDFTCLPEASWRLHQAIPQSKLILVAQGGHLAGEPAMIDALITATDEMAVLLA